MEISFNLLKENQKLLSKVEELEIIKIGTEQIKFANYMVFGKEVDEKIPAILLQLWRFEGGYDHAVINLLESDLGVNSLIKYEIPQKILTKIDSILSYRSNKETLTEKELYFYDVWPDKKVNEVTEEFNIPFECSISVEDKSITVIIPSWTPMQQLPVDRIRTGTHVELWKIDGHYTLMRVLKL